ncbi:MAG: hypothetical protein NT155_01815 [Candidatus Staskawiczbacteria bacterium]|nr:hypothetical protein [Candidatus Staskawiczbacteria bacterium]
MKTHKKFPKSIRIFIRSQKAQIRRQFWDAKKQEEAIKEMYVKLNPVKIIKEKV